MSRRVMVNGYETSLNVWFYDRFTANAPSLDYWEGEYWVMVIRQRCDKRTADHVEEYWKMVLATRDRFSLACIAYQEGDYATAWEFLNTVNGHLLRPLTDEPGERRLEALHELLVLTGFCEETNCRCLDDYEQDIDHFLPCRECGYDIRNHHHQCPNYDGYDPHWYFGD